MEQRGQLFGDLFFVAWKRAEIAQLDTITLSEIAERVGAELGETYAAQTALGWRRGAKPRAPVVNAIAKVLGADPAELRAAERGARSKPATAERYDAEPYTRPADAAAAERKKPRRKAG